MTAKKETKLHVGQDFRILTTNSTYMVNLINFELSDINTDLNC